MTKQMRVIGIVLSLIAYIVSASPAKAAVFVGASPKEVASFNIELSPSTQEPAVITPITPNPVVETQINTVEVETEGTTQATLEIPSPENKEEIKLPTPYRFPVNQDGYRGISSKFNGFHPGIDIRAALKSNVYPMHKGTVVHVGTEYGGYGNYVIVSHENGVESLYAHMGKVFVETGESVYKGTVLGEVGMTGRTTGPHIHMETRFHTKRVNPILFLKDLIPEIAIASALQ